MKEAYGIGAIEAFHNVVADTGAFQNGNKKTPKYPNPAVNVYVHTIAATGYARYGHTALLRFHLDNDEANCSGSKMDW